MNRADEADAHGNGTQRDGGSAHRSGSGRCRGLTRRGRGSARRDRGSATAELAVGLPALVLLLMFALGAVNAVLARMQCVDAARDAALTSARGGDGTAEGQRRAPRGATVSVTVAGQTATAVVRLRVQPLGPYLPSITVTGQAVADQEPDAP